MPPRAVSSTATSTCGFIKIDRCTLRTAAIAFIDAFAGEVHAIGAGHADLFAGRGYDVGEQPRRRCFSVHARHSDDRNAAACDSGNIISTIAWPTGCGVPVGRRQMHPQSGAGIDFDHRAALLAQRPADVFGDDVEARNIQADHANRIDGAAGDFRMNRFGNIGRRAASAQVAIAANEHLYTSGRNRFGRVACSVSTARAVASILMRLSTEPWPSLRRGSRLTSSTSWLNSRVAVADDVGRFATSGRNQLVADDQQPIIFTSDVSFDNDAGTFLMATS